MLLLRVTSKSVEKPTRTKIIKLWLKEIREFFKNWINRVLNMLFKFMLSPSTTILNGLTNYFLVFPWWGNGLITILRRVCSTQNWNLSSQTCKKLLKKQNLTWLRMKSIKFFRREISWMISRRSREREPMKRNKRPPKLRPTEEWPVEARLVEVRLSPLAKDLLLIENETEWKKHLWNLNVSFE